MLGESAYFSFPHRGAYLHSACAYLSFCESAIWIRIKRRISNNFCNSGFFCTSSGSCTGKRGRAIGFFDSDVCGWGVLCGFGVYSAQTDSCCAPSIDMSTTTAFTLGHLLKLKVRFLEDALSAS